MELYELFQTGFCKEKMIFLLKMHRLFQCGLKFCFYEFPVTCWWKAENVTRSLNISKSRFNKTSVYIWIRPVLQQISFLLHSRKCLDYFTKFVWKHLLSQILLVRSGSYWQSTVLSSQAMHDGIYHSAIHRLSRCMMGYNESTT